MADIVTVQKLPPEMAALLKKVQALHWQRDTAMEYKLMRPILGSAPPADTQLYKAVDAKGTQYMLRLDLPHHSVFRHPNGKGGTDAARATCSRSVYIKDKNHGLIIFSQLDQMAAKFVSNDKSGKPSEKVDFVGKAAFKSASVGWSQNGQNYHYLSSKPIFPVNGNYNPMEITIAKQTKAPIKEGRELPLNQKPLQHKLTSPVEPHAQLAPAQQHGRVHVVKPN